MAYWGQFPAYVSMAERRAAAARAIAKLRSSGRAVDPVGPLEGNKIATTFWGRAWCQNLERYSDYETRLPRGRGYLKNGLVLDLQLAAGKLTALVSGSELYEVEIGIQALDKKVWARLVADVGGAIDSVVALLEGRLPAPVMELVIDPARGLFPSPRQIRFACSCPDIASMCKHVAAALYGVGARLDTRPELLFVLRDVDRDELVRKASHAAVAKAGAARKGRQVVDWKRLGKVFGIDLDLKRQRKRK
jgi:uncharacterized Zn finger protein